MNYGSGFKAGPAKAKAKAGKKPILKVDHPLGAMEIYRTAPASGDKGAWRWRLRAKNGKVIAVAGEAYVSKAHAISAAEKLLDYDMGEVNITEVTEPAPAPGPGPTPGPGDPGAPRSLTAVRMGNVVHLEWLAPASGGPVAMYHVDRKSGDGAFVTIVKHEDKLMVTRFDDNQAMANVSYTYRVLAHGVNGVHSAFSNEATIPAFTGDVTPPAVRITAPGDGTSVTGTFEVKVEATDAESGVDRVELFTDGVSNGPQTVLVDNKYRFSVNSKLYANGQHTLRASAFDRVGNKSDSAAVSVNIQN